MVGELAVDAHKAALSKEAVKTTCGHVQEDAVLI
jgi:hypothetical protein